MRTQKVVVVPYDPQWKRDFEQIKREITEAAGPLLAGVEHVGSTAVEGLSAKPIIDIDVVIRDWAVFDSVVCALGRIGYVHEGNLGIPEREAFCYEGKTHLRAHHLYVCPQDSRELARHLVFRDFLRSCPEAARRYGSAKEEAARRFPNSIEGYMACKAPVIAELYALCGLQDGK